MSGRSASAPSSRGFTLLELLLVLAVIALAGVIVFPDLNPALRRTRDEAALRRTVTLLDDLRRRAVATGDTLVVTAGREGRSLLVSSPGGEDQTLEEELPRGVEVLKFEPRETRYFPQGHASGLTLAVKTGSGREATIEVGSFTGLARIADGG